MLHYLRVARALALTSRALTSRALTSRALTSGALISGALVCGSSAAGCYQSHVRTYLSDAGPIDAWSPDTLADTDRCPTPLPCDCPTLDTSGTCGGTSFETCCPIVGPLSPPDLPIA